MNIRFIFFLSAILVPILLLPTLVHSEELVAPDKLTEKQRPIIALVLSGGGAKGAAHIGVIETLEKNHVPIDIVVGTSIGSYVGGLFALGYDSKEIKKLMFGTNWERGFSDFIPREQLLYADKEIRDKYNITFRVGYSDARLKMPSGLLLGQSALQVLKESAGGVGIFENFDELPIPYRAVATDLATSKAVVLHRGSITQSMKASSTVPGALEPTEIDGKLLVDGGISNNMPIDIARELGADIIIAVDIGSSLTNQENITSTVDVLNQLSTIMTVNTTLSQKKLLYPEHDLLIRPQIDELGTSDFSILEKAYQKGIESAEETENIKSLSVSDDEYAQYKQKKLEKRKQWISKLALPVSNIFYNNESDVAVEMISSHFDLHVGSVISDEEVAAAVQRVYALNRFEFVNAEFDDTETGRILTLTTRENSWGPNYLHMGVGLEGDIKGTFIGGIDLGYILTDLNEYGAVWKNEITLGWEMRAATELYQPLDKKELFFTRAKIEYNEDNYLERKSSGKQTRPAFYDRYAQIRLGIGSNYTDYGFSEIGGLAAIGKISEDGSSNKFDYQTYGGYLFLGFDNLNSINLPTSGNKVELKFFLREDDFDSNQKNYDVKSSLQIKLDWRGALELGNHSLVALSSFTAMLADEKKSIHQSELGGFLNLSGYQKDALIGDHKAFAAVVYQYDLAQVSQGVGLPVYLGSSLEAGNVWGLGDDVDMGDLVTSSSLFLGTDTTFGPAIIGIGYATSFGYYDENPLTIFFSLGKTW